MGFHVVVCYNNRPTSSGTCRHYGGSIFDKISEMSHQPHSVLMHSSPYRQRRPHLPLNITFQQLNSDYHGFSYQLLESDLKELRLRQTPLQLTLLCGHWHFQTQFEFSTQIWSRRQHLLLSPSQGLCVYGHFFFGSTK